MAPLLPTTYSWIALTTLTPLSSLLLIWTIVSIHRKHLKSILLLSIVYLQLFLQIFNFGHSTLALLKLNFTYVYYLNYIFTILIIFKSLAVLSSHFEQFYKVKYPSNYLLNVNSSLLKYHLLVLFLLSLMISYLFRNVEFVPLIINPNRTISVGIRGIYYGSSSQSQHHQQINTTSSAEMMFGDSLELIIVFLVFHCILILSSLGFVLFKAALLSKSSCKSRNSNSLSSLDINIIGTNSTSSSTNLYGSSSSAVAHLHGHKSSGLVQSRTITVVGMVNLMINLTLVICTFSNFWLPSSLSSWPLSNFITWSQVIESLITPIVYSLIQVQVYHHHRHGGAGTKSSYTNTSGSSSSTNNDGSVIYHSNNNSNNNRHLINDRRQNGGGVLGIGIGRTESRDQLVFQQNHRRNQHHHHPLEYHNHRFPVTNGSLCFNNGEFQYFAGCKNSSASILNNAAYNTLDSSINQTMRSTYSKDSLRCASVTTIANDDFEFLSRRTTNNNEEQLLHNNNINNSSINQIGLLSTQQQETPSHSQQSTITVNSTAALIPTAQEQQSSQSHNSNSNNKSNNANNNLLQQYFQCINNANFKNSCSKNNKNLLNNYNSINHSFRQRVVNNNNAANANGTSSSNAAAAAIGIGGGLGGNTSNNEMSTNAIIPSSLSMNDLDLIVGNDDYDEEEDNQFNQNGRRDNNNVGISSSSSSRDRPLLLESLNNNANNLVNNKCKYKKNSNYCIKRRFPNNNNNSGNNNNNALNHNSNSNNNNNCCMVKGGLTRRVLSLESLQSTVNESHSAYLDTGERVIVFTTDYL